MTPDTLQAAIAEHSLSCFDDQVGQHCKHFQMLPPLDKAADHHDVAALLITLAAMPSECLACEHLLAHLLPVVSGILTKSINELSFPEKAACPAVGGTKRKVTYELEILNLFVQKST